MRKVTLITVCCTVAFASAGHTQESTPAALDPARRAIEVELPQAGSSNIGFWWVRSPEMRLGVAVSASYSEDRNSAAGGGGRAWEIAAGPAIKRHVLVSGPVVPHLRGGLRAGVGGSNSAGDTRSPRSLSLSATGGFGVDWFPYDRVAIGAHSGMQFWVRRVSTEIAEERISRTMYDLRTFTSALNLQLYF